MEDSQKVLVPGMVGERKQPVILIAQLMRNVAYMQHIDEVFRWLSNAMVRYLDIPAVQFWVAQLDTMGRFQTEVRALTSQNASLPEQVYVNNQVMTMVKRIFYAKRTNMSVPVESIFSPSQASLFALYSLHYWTGYFLSSDALLSSTRTEAASKETSIPLTIIVPLLTQVPLSTDQRRAVDFILKQSMRIIINRDLITSQASASLETAEKEPDKDTAITLTDIIPTRSQDIGQFQADNPFANAAIIADKNARRLYSAVDGCRNVAELAQILHLNQKEMIKPLRYLFQQQKIEFYTSKGEHVEHLPFLLSAS